MFCDELPLVGDQSLKRLVLIGCRTLRRTLHLGSRGAGDIDPRSVNRSGANKLWLAVLVIETLVWLVSRDGFLALPAGTALLVAVLHCRAGAGHAHTHRH